MKKQYILIAGVNGAGKSTLYLSHPEFFKGTLRLNADEILQENNGDWRIVADTMKSMRELIGRMNHYFEEGTSFHHETTLAGNVHGYQKRLKQAKRLGYETTLIYLYLADADLAVERVAKRVAKGGHGVEEAVIRRRYEQSIKHFKELHPQFDNVFVLDNTFLYKATYQRQNDIEFYNFLPKKVT